MSKKLSSPPAFYLTESLRASPLDAVFALESFLRLRLGWLLLLCLLLNFTFAPFAYKSGGETEETENHNSKHSALHKSKTVWREYRLGSFAVIVIRCARRAVSLSEWKLFSDWRGGKGDREAQNFRKRKRFCCRHRDTWEENYFCFPLTRAEGWTRDGKNHSKKISKENRKFLFLISPQFASLVIGINRNGADDKLSTSASSAIKSFQGESYRWGRIWLMTFICTPRRTWITQLDIEPKDATGKVLNERPERCLLQSRKVRSQTICN